MITAIDTETGLATDEQPVPDLVCVSMAWTDPMIGNDGRLLHTRDERTEQAVARAFVSGRVVFANAPYDVHVLGRRFPDLWPLMIRAYLDGRVFDILTREKLIDIFEGQHFRRGKYGLGDVASRRAGIELDKDDPWRRRYIELIDTPIHAWPQEAKHYALTDAEATLSAFVAQEGYTTALVDQARQARGHLALYAQTLAGIHTDPAMVARVDALLEEQRIRHTATLLGTGLARMQGVKKPKVVRNTKAAKAMAEAYAKEHDRPIKRSAKTKAVSLTEDALEALLLPFGHPLYSYQAAGSIQALQSKNVEPLRHPIVRTRYDECIGTGRTSSSAPGQPWHGTNLQNLPRSIAKALGFENVKEMNKALGTEVIGAMWPDGAPVKASVGFRECLVPPPGHKLVAADWGMMELVCLAQVQIDILGRSKLGDALRDGRDPHEELGSTIAGFDIKGHPERKTWRTLAKAPNFGYPGGLGAKRFVDFARGTYGIVISEKRAKELKALWQRQWPEMKPYHDWVQRMPVDGSDRWGKPLRRVTLPRTGFTRGMCTFNEAANFPFQGTAAACAKDALFALWLACRPGGPLDGCWQVLFVHDENVLCVPEGRVDHAVPIIEGIMKEAVARICPDVPVSVETMILDRYTK